MVLVGSPDLLWAASTEQFSDGTKSYETDDFFKTNSCENEERNLKYIRIVGDDINKYIIPDRYKNKYGLWLIGYDGGDKSYSNDTSLLKEIHNIIDTMPIRKSEMTDQKEKCN